MSTSVPPPPPLTSSSPGCRGDRRDEDDMKSMKLYRNIDRIWNELKELGFTEPAQGGSSIGDGGLGEEKKLIPVELLNQFDCYDYCGGRGVVSELLPLLSTSSSETSSCTVLDVGSGLGGPARCLSHCCGGSGVSVAVTGVELQEDVAVLGNELSRLCGMTEKVTIIAGDIVNEELELASTSSEGYDAAMSILTILHIPLSIRVSMFKRCYDLLKPGGVMYIEDYFRKTEEGFTSEEKELLQQDVSIDNGALPTEEEYIAQVKQAGFTSVTFLDVTEEWSGFTAERMGKWREQRERHERVHNAVTWQSLNSFYTAVATLFAGGRLGGTKITLTKGK